MTTPVALTEAMVSQKTRLSLSAVKKLNMWGLNLGDVSIVSQMPNLEVLSLSVNSIRSLQPFSHCPNLTELFLRGNLISDFSELQYLSGLPRLRVLWLSENPIASHPNYRERILQMLPGLEKLDETDVAKIEKPPTERPAERHSVDRSPERPPVERSPERSPIDRPPVEGSPAERSSVRRATTPDRAESPRADARTVQRRVAPRGSRANDEPLLTAVLALLPELSPESLRIVLKKIEELSMS